MSDANRPDDHDEERTEKRKLAYEDATHSFAEIDTDRLTPKPILGDVPKPIVCDWKLPVCDWPKWPPLDKYPPIEKPPIVDRPAGPAGPFGQPYAARQLSMAAGGFAGEPSATPSGMVDPQGSLTLKPIWYDPKLPWYDPKLPWQDPKLPWQDPKLPWFDPKAPWQDPKSLWKDLVGDPDPKGRLDPKNIVDPKGNLDPKNIIDPKNTLDPKTTLDPKGNLDPKNIYDPKSPLDPKNVLDPDKIAAYDPGDIFDPGILVRRPFVLGMPHHAASAGLMSGADPAAMAAMTGRAGSHAGADDRTASAASLEQALSQVETSMRLLKRDLDELDEYYRELRERYDELDEESGDASDDAKEGGEE